MSDESKEVEVTETFVERETTGIQPVETSFNLETSQEKTRAWLAKALVIVYGGTIFSFLLFSCFELLLPQITNTAVTEKTLDALKDIFSLLLTSETGIIGTALGFYFANQQKK